MTNIEYKATLQMLIPMLIQTIMTNKKLSITDSIKTLYCSKLYEKLEKESTKLWHFSPFALYELLEIELKTGKLIFPS
jgi:hypothetical protein